MTAKSEYRKWTYGPKPTQRKAKIHQSRHVLECNREDIVVSESIVSLRVVTILLADGTLDHRTTVLPNVD